MCNTNFGQKGNLYQHVATVPEGRKTFKCDICKNFGRKAHLNQHVATMLTLEQFHFKKDEKPWKDLTSCVIIMHCALCTIDWQHKVCSWTLNYYNFISHKDEKPWKDLISCVIIMHCALCTIDWQHQVCSWTQNYYNFISNKELALKRFNLMCNYYALCIVHHWLTTSGVFMNTKQF